MQLHKIVIPREMLSYGDAPYMRVYIAESIGFSMLGFRLCPDLLFCRRYGFVLTLENQRCLAEMLEFQFGKENSSRLLLQSNWNELEEDGEDGIVVDREEIGHVLVFKFRAATDANYNDRAVEELNPSNPSNSP